MRRNLLVAMVASVLMLITALLGVSSANAAPARPGVVPDVHLGQMCRDVKSSVNNRSGEICILVNNSDAQPFKYQALVSFTAKSGTLKEVEVNHLNFDFDSVTKKSVSFDSKDASGESAFISTPWWDQSELGVADAKVFNACMYWTDGGRACTAQENWFYSEQIDI